MCNFTSTHISYHVFKDHLPKVYSGTGGVPYVKIPDPANPGSKIKFSSIPGDKVTDLYNLAAAYLALAQNLEQRAEAAGTAGDRFTPDPSIDSPTSYLNS